MLSYLRSFLQLWRLRSNNKNVQKMTIRKDELLPTPLIQATTNNPSIQSLHIEYRLANFTQSLWDALLQVIDKNQSIQTLDFSFADLGDNEIQKLVPHLKVNQNIRKLNFRKNNITAAGAAALTEILTSNNRLKKIILSGNPLGKGFNDIFQALQENAQLTSLIISDKWEPNGIDDTHISALIEMVKLNETLKELNLCGNQFSNQGIQQLCQGLLMNNGLNIVNLDSTSIGDEGWLAIGEWISKTTSLQSLSIGNEIAKEDSITEAGLTGFLNAFKLNTSIKHLSISFKKDSDMLAIKLADVLKTNHTLESITFKNCPHAMKQKGMEALVSVLKTNTTVHEIKEGESIKVKPSPSQVKPETTKELQRLLTRNKLIKAIKENPSTLPQVIKNVSYIILDDIFFATIIKSLPEHSLIGYEQLLTDLMQNNLSRIATLKRWLGIKRDSTNIRNVLSILAHQAQTGDASSQMALGYIYKNQLFNQSLNTAQAKACFELATTSKDKRIAANAHFEVGHLHFIYTHDLQRATAHFDQASQYSDTTHHTINEQARRLRNHALYTLNNSHTFTLPNEIEQKAQLNNFHQRQEFLLSIKGFFAALNKTLSKDKFKPSFIRANQAVYFKQRGNLPTIEPNNNLIINKP